MGDAMEKLLIMNDYIFVFFPECLEDLDILVKHSHFALLQY